MDAGAEVGDIGHALCHVMMMHPGVSDPHGHGQPGLLPHAALLGLPVGPLHRVRLLQLAQHRAGLLVHTGGRHTHSCYPDIWYYSDVITDNTYVLLPSGPGQGAADQLQDGGCVNHDDQGNVT